VTTLPHPQRALRDKLDPLFLPNSPYHPPVEWRIEPGLTDYAQAVDFMAKRVEEIHQGRAAELVWLVEHPPLYTAGTSAKSEDLLDPDRLPVFVTGRGGEYTYHGPGQRVAYVMLDLKARRPDVRAFVSALEAWIIRTLQHFTVTAERREDRVGVWVVRPEKPEHFDLIPSETKTALERLPKSVKRFSDKRRGETQELEQESDSKITTDALREDKIAAIGVRLKKWVSFHGVAVNIAPNLAHYDGIVPCGIKTHGVTSLADLGLCVTMAQFDEALSQAFHEIFG